MYGWYRNSNNDYNNNYHNKYSTPNYYGEYDLDNPDVDTNARGNNIIRRNTTMNSRTKKRMLEERKKKRLEIMNQIAAGSGSLSAFKHGLEMYKIDPDGLYADDKKQESFLVIALKNQNFEIVNYLLKELPADKHITLNFPTKERFTAAKTYVVYDENEPMIIALNKFYGKFLLDIIKKGNPILNNYVEDNVSGKRIFRPFLHYVVSKLNYYTDYDVDETHILNELITKYKADPKMVDSNGNTLLDAFPTINNIYIDFAKKYDLKFKDEQKARTLIIDILRAGYSTMYPILVDFFEYFNDYPFNYTNLLYELIVSKHSTYSGLPLIKLFLQRGGDPFKRIHGISAYSKMIETPSYSILTKRNNDGKILYEQVFLLKAFFESAYERLKGKPIERAQRLANEYILGYLSERKTDIIKNLFSQLIYKLKQTGHPLGPALETIVNNFLKPAPWQGFPRQVASRITEVFSDINNVSICPVCLTPYPREGGCLYMNCNCPLTSEKSYAAFAGWYNKELYAKYRSESGKIWWCVSCNRICAGHRHYNLHRYNDPAPSLYVKPPNINPANEAAMNPMFGESCKNAFIGGGGVEEKMVRLHALLAGGADANGLIGTIDRETVLNNLSEACFNFPTVIPNVEAAGAGIIAAGKFNETPDMFPEVEPPSVSENITLPNIRRQIATRPVIIDKVMENAISLNDVSPVYRFIHESGRTLNKHTESQVLGKDSLIAWAQKPMTDDDFGKCPFWASEPPCKALLYPDELENIVPDEILDKYRKNFNKKFADVARVRGGSKRHKTVRHNRQRHRRKTVSQHS